MIVKAKNSFLSSIKEKKKLVRVQWLSGKVLDSPRSRNPSLVLVQPRKTRPYITERLLMGRKELNQNKI